MRNRSVGDGTLAPGQFQAFQVLRIQVDLNVLGRLFFILIEISSSAER